MAAQRISGAVAGTTFAALHLIGGLLTLAVASVAPPVVAVALAVLWLVAARLGWRARRRTPVAVMLLPLGYAGLLLAALAIGTRDLGWGA